MECHPATAGDILRRFEESHLRALQDAIDEARARIWKALPRRQRVQITLEVDSSFKVVYGDCKEGDCFSHQGTWSHHPLLFAFAETGELLRVVNRPGNHPSAEGAAEMLGPAWSCSVSSSRTSCWWSLEVLHGPRLRRENRILREVREIPRRAAAWFATETDAAAPGSSTP